MRLIGLLLCLTAFGCKNEGGPPPVDMSMVTPDLSVSRHCGNPGDTGNNLGVGKYCQSQADCAGLTANFCPVQFNPNATFCTIIFCTPDPDGGATAECGDQGARCRCQGTNCACAPGRCLQ
jgi:hypothetical protein